MDGDSLQRLALGTVIAIWRERIWKIVHGDTLKQVELQKSAKLSTGSVSRFERGVTSPNQEELRRIAEALHTDVPELTRERELLVDLLGSALGPLHLGNEYPPLSSPTDEIGEGRPGMPEALRRRWDALLNAERKLALDRSLLEYETLVHANRDAIGQGPSR
jgi:transcriptional regulator with XRE-family HTH domain